MNSAVFGKTMKNVRNDGDIKLITTKGKRNYLVSEPNYHTKYKNSETFRKISENLAIGRKRTAIFMNKPVYLGLSILELSKILTNEFCYDYVKLKQGEKAKLCCIDTDKFISTQKQKTFMQTSQKMLKQDLILQIMN